LHFPFFLHIIWTDPLKKGKGLRFGRGAQTGRKTGQRFIPSEERTFLKWIFGRETETIEEGKGGKASG